MHLVGVYLIGVDLIGVDLIGTHLMTVSHRQHLIGMYLIGVHGPASQGRASHGHTSCVGLIGMYNTLSSAQAIPRAA
jgi:hypothetical protein